MNKKIRYIPKLALACLFIILLSCQAEELAVENQKPDNPKINLKKITFQDLDNYNPKTLLTLQKILKPSKNSQSASRGANESNTYVVDSTNIIYINNNEGYDSFTFKVITDPEADYIQNIVISNYADGTSNTYLSEYNLNTNASKIDEELIKDYITGTTFYNLDGANLTYAKGGSDELCVDIGYYTYVDKCQGELVTPGENPGCFNADGTRAQKKVFVISASYCSDGGGSGTPGPGMGLGDGIGNPGTGPGTGGGGGTTNPGSGSTPITNPVPGNTVPPKSGISGPGGTIITTPIGTPVPYNPGINHVSELNKITNRPEVKTRINELKQQVTTATMEQGSEYFTDEPLTNPLIREDPFSDFRGVHFEEAYPNSILRVHMHQINLQPIFSGEDIRGMAIFFKEKIKSETPDAQNISSLLVGNLGIFALRVTNATEAKLFADSFIYKAQNTQFLLNYDAMVKNNAESECNCTEQSDILDKLLLNYLIKFLITNKTGLTLYTANTNPDGSYSWTPTSSYN